MYEEPTVYCTLHSCLKHLSRRSRSYAPQILVLLPRDRDTVSSSRHFLLGYSFLVLTVSHYITYHFRPAYILDYNNVTRESLQTGKPLMEPSISQNFVRILSNPVLQLYHSSMLPPIRNFRHSRFCYAILH